MNLPIPTAGVTAGPEYATDINNSLTLVDSHDHTPGKGVQITPAGLNINTTLPMANNFLTGVAGITLTAQSSTPAVGTVYESGNDLYYVDGIGNNVRITASGAVAGTPGSISGLVSPASASYVSGSSTFVWRSNTTTAANMDMGSIIIREVSPAANGITISSPTALGANYALTLMTGLPAARKIMAVDNTGAISSTLDVDGSTITISGSTMAVPNLGIGTAQLANNSVTIGKLAASTRQLNKVILSTSGTHTFPSDTTTSTVFKLTVVGGGGGGGADTSAGGGGGGGAGATNYAWITGIAPSATQAYTIGVGGAGFGAGNPGAGGGDTIFDTIVAGGGVGGGSVAAGGLGGLGGACSGGTIGPQGGCGNPGAIVAGIGSLGGTGGCSSIGGGGRGASASVTAIAGNAGGGGGGGAASNPGVAGGAGLIIIEWVN